MELTEIVTKLVGDIRPRGETNHDEDSFKNLKVMLKLIEELTAEVKDISYRNQHAQEYSIKRSVEYINQFLADEIGIKP